MGPRSCTVQIHLYLGRGLYDVHCAPVRKNKLLTMAPMKTGNKRSINQKEKDFRQVTKCLRQRLTWCNRTGQVYDTTSEQYSVYPRAICDEHGAPVKGDKVHMET